MKVKNIKKTFNKKCNCENWLKHWENNKKGKFPVYCITVNCYNSVSVGGIVIKTEGIDENNYIIPICDVCNAKTINYSVKDGNFVSVNKSQKCDK